MSERKIITHQQWTSPMPSWNELPDAPPEIEPWRKPSHPCTRTEQPGKPHDYVLVTNDRRALAYCRNCGFTFGALPLTEGQP